LVGVGKEIVGISGDGSLVLRDEEAKRFGVTFLAPEHECFIGTGHGHLRGRTWGIDGVVFVINVRPPEKFKTKRLPNQKARGYVHGAYVAFLLPKALPFLRKHHDEVVPPRDDKRDDGR